MIFVPPPFAADAIMEAADAGIKVIVAITEGIPVLDMVKAKAFLKDKPRACSIGPNCPGVITPGECKIGIMPGYIHTAGERSEERENRRHHLPQRHADLRSRLAMRDARHRPDHRVGIGGDPVKGLNFIELLDLFNKDAATRRDHHDRRDRRHATKKRRRRS